MPFDGLPDDQQLYLLSKLDSLSELLATEDRWCKYRLREAGDRRCLLGALIDSNARLVLSRPVLNAARAVTGRRYVCIANFNDAPTTRFATVQVVLERVRADIVAMVVPRGQSYHLCYVLARRLEVCCHFFEFGACFLMPFSRRPRARPRRLGHLSLRKGKPVVNQWWQRGRMGASAQSCCTDGGR